MGWTQEELQAARPERRKANAGVLVMSIGPSAGKRQGRGVRQQSHLIATRLSPWQLERSTVAESQTPRHARSGPGGREWGRGPGVCTARSSLFFLADTCDALNLEREMVYLGTFFLT